MNGPAGQALVIRLELALPALKPHIYRPLIAVLEPLLIAAVEDDMKLRGVDPALGGRPRVAILRIFDKVLQVHVGGLSYEFVADDRVSATTVRRYLYLWMKAGVFKRLKELVDEARGFVGEFDIEHVAIDGSHVKAPGGGDESGPSPVDRGRLGRKFSTLVDGDGYPLVTVVASGNSHERSLLEETLDRFEALGLRNPHCPTMVHLDAGYDARWVIDMLKERGYHYEIACRYGDPTHKNCRSKTERRRAYREAKNEGRSHYSNPGNRAANRWYVERTFSWMKRGFKKLAVQHDRNIEVVKAWVDLAHAIIGIKDIVRRGRVLRRWDGRPEKLAHMPHERFLKARDQYWRDAKNLHLPPIGAKGAG